MSHRNINPDTIMVDYAKTFKLADIGYGKLKDDKIEVELKELGYAAPEVIKARMAGKVPGGDAYKADVFSVGLVALELGGADVKSIMMDVG